MIAVFISNCIFIINWCNLGCNRDTDMVVKVSHQCCIADIHIASSIMKTINTINKNLLSSQIDAKNLT